VDSEGARLLLQQRVSLLGSVLLLIGLALQAVVRWVAYRFGDSPYAAGSEWTANSHLVVLASLGLIVLRTRRGRCSLRELAVLDVLSIWVPLGFSAFALWPAPPVVHPEMVFLLGASHQLLLRAVLVPSSGRRTAAIGLVVFGLLVGWTHFYYRRFSSPNVAPVVLQTVTTATWAGFAVLISTLASHVIFGLRERVRRASELGQYTLLRKIGEGGMGVVYEARHALLRRRTAVKLLPADRAGEQSIARFEREVQLTSQLSHPGIVAVYDFGRSADGVFYYAMEYVDGIDLEALVRLTGEMPAARVRHILMQAAEALAEAHSVGLIHRDVKPANLLLCQRPRQSDWLKVVDFGLVKHATAGYSDLSDSRMLIGTPTYMPPEALIDPARVDARSDLYALGAVGYFLLTGGPVFAGESAVEVYGLHLHSEVVPPSQRSGQAVPAMFERLILSCLAKKQDERPISAEALLAAITACTDVPDWTDEDAANFWQSAAPKLKRASSESGLGFSSRTLAVDFDQRASAQRLAASGRAPLKREQR